MWLIEKHFVPLEESTPSGIGMDNTYRCGSLRKLINEIRKNSKGLGFDV